MQETTRVGGKYRNEGAMCKFCNKFDSSSHLMRCDAFSHLRGPEVFLEDDGHLVKYLRPVLQLREDKEKELEKKKEQEKEQEGRSWDVYWPMRLHSETSPGREFLG